MTDPIPLRPRTKVNRGAVVVFVVLAALAVAGVVSTAVLITLALTGQIG